MEEKKENKEDWAKVENEKERERKRRKEDDEEAQKGERRKGGEKSGSCCIGAAVCENTHSALLSPRCLMRRASQE